MNEKSETLHIRETFIGGFVLATVECVKHVIKMTVVYGGKKFIGITLIFINF